MSKVLLNMATHVDPLALKPNSRRSAYLDIGNSLLDIGHFCWILDIFLIKNNPPYGHASILQS